MKIAAILKACWLRPTTLRIIRIGGVNMLTLTLRLDLLRLPVRINASYELVLGIAVQQCSNASIDKLFVFTVMLVHTPCLQQLL
jgi:hypothetical protein